MSRNQGYGRGGGRDTVGPSRNLCGEAKMTDMSQLIFGSLLILLGGGSMAACIPRKGKMAWFVGKPFLESGVSVLLIFTFAIGFLLLTAYFTAIDDATLAGAIKHS
jgi:hypothetical protein